MKSHRVCLLLVIILSTAALSRGQTWQDFSNKHINPTMTITQCDTVIKDRRIWDADNNCKPTNTFILATPDLVQDVCRDAGQHYQGSNTNYMSNERFTIIVCRQLGSGARPPNCPYRDPADMYTNFIVVTCDENRLPVHWVTNVQNH